MTNCGEVSHLNAEDQKKVDAGSSLTNIIKDIGLGVILSITIEGVRHIKRII